MNTYREQKISDYIDENYPNAKIVNYLNDDSDLVYYSDEELSSIDGDWFPLCCYRNEKGKLVYGGREKIVHTYTEGETGAGKTTRFVMQSIVPFPALRVACDKNDLYGLVFLADTFGQIDSRNVTIS